MRDIKTVESLKLYFMFTRCRCKHSICPSTKHKDKAVLVVSPQSSLTDLIREYRFGDHHDCVRMPLPDAIPKTPQKLSGALRAETLGLPWKDLDFGSNACECDPSRSN